MGNQRIVVVQTTVGITQGGSIVAWLWIYHLLSETIQNALGEREYGFFAHWWLLSIPIS